MTSRLSAVSMMIVLAAAHSAGCASDGPPLCQGGNCLADGGSTIDWDAAGDFMSGGGCQGTDAGCLLDASEPEPFWTLAVLPDTQASYYFSPNFFAAETNWIAQNHAVERIKFVLHEGDIVDTPGDPGQWEVARASLSMLDGQVAYALCPGNHDFLVGKDSNLTRATLLNQYFPFAELAATPTFGGAFEDGHRENAFYLFPAGGRTWLVLALEFSPRPEVVAWANDVLSANANHPAIVLTHAYLYSDGRRYDLSEHVCKFGGDDCPSIRSDGWSPQCWNPTCYLPDGEDGEMLWQSLVRLHSNVLFVFSGHVANPAPFDAALLTSVRDDGTVCHQIMADYQALPPNGGDGYLRLVRFWNDGRVQVRTFSPSTDSAYPFMEGDRNEFDLQVQVTGQ